jgi:hypothetical protein
VNRRFAASLLLVAPLLGLVACSSSTGGNAFPTAGATDGGSGGSSSTSSSPETGGDIAQMLRALQPCSLLSSAQLSQYQLAQIDAGNKLGTRYCRWQKPLDVNTNNGFAVEIGLRDSQGVKDINTDGEILTNNPVGKHHGTKVQDANSAGGCFVAIYITDSTRVDVVGVDTLADMSKSCQIAETFATLIEPELPGGGR